VAGGNIEGLVPDVDLLATPGFPTGAQHRTLLVDRGSVSVPATDAPQRHAADRGQAPQSNFSAMGANFPGIRPPRVSSKRRLTTRTDPVGQPSPAGARALPARAMRAVLRGELWAREHWTSLTSTSRLATTSAPSMKKAATLWTISSRPISPRGCRRGNNTPASALPTRRPRWRTGFPPP